MSHLRSLQRRFQAYLTESSEAIKKDIVSTPDAPAEHRLGTYFNAYRIRLIDCLAIDYSGLQKYLGDQAFENLALAYLEAHPSSAPSIRWFGKDLFEYLASTYTHRDREFLSELANFEWTQGLVFDARDETRLYRLDDMAMPPSRRWRTWSRSSARTRNSTTPAAGTSPPRSRPLSPVSVHAQDLYFHLVIYFFQNNF